jgi:hypothetical protein
VRAFEVEEKPISTGKTKKELVGNIIGKVGQNNVVGVKGQGGNRGLFI